MPPFNPDLDGPSPPGTVEAFRREVASADAILIASPEYAFAVPGALKNALDWLVSSGDIYGKPVAVVAGSPRADGGLHVRADLERTLAAQGAVVMSSVTIQVPRRNGHADPALSRPVRAALAAVLTEHTSNAPPRRSA